MTALRPPLAFLGELRPAFLAHVADRLDREICAQTEGIATDMGVTAPIKTFSALLFLARQGPASIAEISEIDGQSHQLVAARLVPLERLGLIERIADPDDARRKPYRLTAAGREDAARVERAAERIAAAMEAMFGRIGCDVLATLDETLEELRREPLGAGGGRAQARQGAS